jgi:hypothetical protein
MTNFVENYFSDLKFRFNIIKKHSTETDLFLSTKFSVFDYIYVDENKLSDVIADLLNPYGNHGQQDLFLVEFVKIIKLDNFNTYTFPKVNREIGTKLISKTQRRMDILIEWETTGIMIENKPWAKDQNEQISDYKEYLTRRFNEKFVIIYLSKNYNKPEKHSISHQDLQILIKKKQFIQISFENELKMWVKNCAKECQSERIRYFLKDFLTYLNNNFN